MVKNLDIFAAVFRREILVLQEIRICNDGRQRCLQVMGHIRDQLRLHFLALDLLGHRDLHALAHAHQIFAQRLKRARVRVNLGVQLPLGHILCGLPHHIILCLEPIQKSHADGKYHNAVYDRAQNAKEPETGQNRHDPKVCQQHLEQYPVVFRVKHHAPRRLIEFHRFALDEPTEPYGQCLLPEVACRPFHRQRIQAARTSK